jgi:hypothetical protein
VSDRELYIRVLDRYIAATKHDSNVPIDTFDVIVFLEKEIDSYRDEIGKKKIMLNSMYGAQTAGAITGRLNEWKNENAVRELRNKYDALCERVEQLGQMVENNMNSTTDGVMTLSRKTASWKLVAECLLSNGYFVCSHIDDDNNDETITIEYWRA